MADEQSIRAGIECAHCAYPFDADDTIYTDGDEGAIYCSKTCARADSEGGAA